MTLYERLLTFADKSPDAKLRREAADALMTQAQDNALLRGRVEQLAAQVELLKEHNAELERKLGNG